MNKKKFLYCIELVDKIKNFVIHFGIMFFAGIGFILSFLSITILITQNGGTIPKILLYIWSGFIKWISFSLILVFISLAMRIIYKNDKNWKRK